MDRMNVHDSVFNYLVFSDILILDCRCGYGFMAVVFLLGKSYISQAWWVNFLFDMVGKDSSINISPRF